MSDKPPEWMKRHIAHHAGDGAWTRCLLPAESDDLVERLACAPDPEGMASNDSNLRFALGEGRICSAEETAAGYVAVARGQMGWQPIDTASKDGAWVRIRFFRRNVFERGASAPHDWASVGRHVASDPATPTAWQSDNGEGFHWQPLPRAGREPEAKQA